MTHSTAICTLNMIPMRSEPKHKSEMVSMLLFGEVFTVNESLDHWHHISARHDGYEGWIYGRLLHLVDEEFLKKYDGEKPVYCGDMLATAHNGDRDYYMCFGSRLPLFDGENFYLGHEKVNFGAHATIASPGMADKNAALAHAKQYLHTPYLWGGRSLLGIDCSGFTQMVFALSGLRLPRDAWQQAEQGTKVEHLSEAKAGDLAFFSENGQRVTHVGILTGDGHIIHASDEVRMDRIDNQGIFNKDLDAYTLKANMIKRY